MEHSADTSVTDNIITPRHRPLQALNQANNGERVRSSREGALPYILTGRAAGREGYQEDCHKLCLSLRFSNFSMLAFDS